MLRGELDTMPLAEVLQWIDLSSRSGLLVLNREGHEVWMHVDGRLITAASPAPAGTDVIARLKPRAADEPWLELPDPLEAHERLLDLFLEDDGTFVFEPGVPDPEGAVQVEIPVRQLVHEGMRHRDEWPQVEAAYPDESAGLHIADAAAAAGVSGLGRILLRCAQRGLTLGQVRVSFALSRSAILRRVHDLVRLGALRVEGADAGADPVGQLTAQAMQLATAGQYDEARHVLETVLATDPSDARLRALLDDVSGRQLDELRQTFVSELTIYRISHAGRGGAAGLTATERELYERIEGGMAIGTLVLTSPLRELETLRTLEKMLHLDLIGLSAS
ncbi:MAG: DUF4388 domain-containing protein [Deltaproteobacteria bacterium]|nr:DUF4388 domain-containing protein [Deltaproteobacteria bacterium]